MFILSFSCLSWIDWVILLVKNKDKKQKKTNYIILLQDISSVLEKYSYLERNFYRKVLWKTMEKSFQRIMMIVFVGWEEKICQFWQITIKDLNFCINSVVSYLGNWKFKLLSLAINLNWCFGSENFTEICCEISRFSSEIKKIQSKLLIWHSHSLALFLYQPSLVHWTTMRAAPHIV